MNQFVTGRFAGMDIEDVKEILIKEYRSSSSMPEMLYVVNQLALLEYNDMIRSKDMTLSAIDYIKDNYAKLHAKYISTDKDMYTCIKLEIDELYADYNLDKIDAVLRDFGIYHPGRMEHNIRTCWNILVVLIISIFTIIFVKLFDSYYAAIFDLFLIMPCKTLYNLLKIAIPSILIKDPL